MSGFVDPRDAEISRLKAKLAIAVKALKELQDHAAPAVAILALRAIEGTERRPPVGVTNEQWKDLYNKSQSEISRLKRELEEARRLLFLGHGCDGLYGDDGEMQCSACGIDFKRDPIPEIDQRTRARGMPRLAESIPHDAAIRADEREKVAKRCLDIATECISGCWAEGAMNVASMIHSEFLEGK